MRPGNYAEQARTYDRTRRPSPSVLAAVREALGPGEGRRLADVAGGTGNYAAELTRDGFRAIVVDAEPEMLRRAEAKLGPAACVAADAAALPFPAATFDCATLLSAIHLFADKPGALRETRRVLREGPLVVQAFTRENLVPLRTGEWFERAVHEEVRETESDHVELLRAAGFSTVEVRRIAYRGLEDGSFSALQTDAALLADEANLRNTSYWQGLDPGARARTLGRLQAALASGELGRRVEEGLQLAERWGHTTVFVARA